MKPMDEGRDMRKWFWGVAALFLLAGCGGNDLTAVTLDKFTVMLIDGKERKAAICLRKLNAQGDGMIAGCGEWTPIDVVHKTL